MAEISFDSVFNAFLGKVVDYDFIDIDESYIRNLSYEWIVSIISEPRLRAMLSSLSLNQENQTISFTIAETLGDDYDSFFLTDLLSTGFVIKWLTPQVNSVLNIKQVFGGKEEKYYSQSAHLAELSNLLKESKTEFNKKIRDYGTYYNSYIREG